MALPKYQKGIYCDEEVFGENFPSSVKILSDNEEYKKKSFEWYTKVIATNGGIVD